MKNVKEMLVNVKEMLKGKTAKIAVTTTGALTTFCVNTFALPQEDGIAMATNALNEILTYVRVIGGFISVFSAIGWILAYKSSNSEQQSNAAMFLACGLALCSIKTILQKIGII